MNISDALYRVEDGSNETLQKKVSEDVPLLESTCGVTDAGVTRGGNTQGGNTDSTSNTRGGNTDSASNTRGGNTDSANDTQDEVFYELATIKYDPALQKIEEIAQLVVDFIRDRKLIIYGGLAIDYALRLCGDSIYSDEVLQIDYDFLSPDNIEDAYDLAEIIYEYTGREDVRAINALHLGTMRVDISANHFLADVSHSPPEVFPHLPTINYQGMRCIHPDFQRIDMHSSLSFPFDFAPMEVIFHRWKKDVKRLLLINKYYPISSKSNDDGFKEVDVDKSKEVDGGSKKPIKAIASVSSIVDLEPQTRKELEEYVIAGPWAVNLFLKEESDTIRGPLIIACQDIEDAARRLNLQNCKQYRRYINLVPRCIIGVLPRESIHITLLSTSGRLLSICTLDENHPLRIASPHYLMRCALADMYRVEMDSGSLYAKVCKYDFRSQYTRLLDYVIKDPKFGLSIEIYGSENTSEAKSMGIARVLNDRYGSHLDALASTYRPARGGRKKYVKGELYMEAGNSV